MITFERDVNCLWFPPDPISPALDDLIPVILFLHGVGERGQGGQDLNRVALWGLPKFRAQGQRISDDPFPFLVIAPQCPVTKDWCNADLLTALERLVDTVVEHHNGDSHRLYVTGFSMGGIGAFGLALQRSEKFAALASVCGACLKPWALPQLAALPVWIAYAEDDEIQALTIGSKLAIKCLAPYGRLEKRAYRLGRQGELGAHPRTADAAYAEPDLYRWLLKQRR